MLNEENLRRAFLEKNNDFKKNTLEYFFNAENHWKYWLLTLLAPEKITPPKTYKCMYKDIS